MLTVALLVMLTFLVARALTALAHWLVPLSIVVLAGWFMWQRVDVLYSGPLRAPLGYSNAAGSLFMLAAVAALLWFVRSRRVWLRVATLVAAFAFASVPLSNGTRTASMLLLLLPAAAAAGLAGRGRWAVAGSATVLSAVMLAVGLLAATYDRGDERSGRLDVLVDGTLSERRVQLWRDAAEFAVAYPLVGVGPGVYPRVSAVSRLDRDTIWPHNEFLQVAAEAGIPALLLLLGLFATLFRRLWHSADSAAASIGAFALGAAGVHASVDYVFHFPAIPMVAAAIVAAAMGRARRPTARRRSSTTPREHDPDGYPRRRRESREEPGGRRHWGRAGHPQCSAG
jgi:O-antigen ligase